ncbi:MAG TPA: hypothetical protein PL037_01350, partial [Elusimicrobiales bacterium]|nr:hypothetical protein [Elusimicrobiales bacterium]
MTQAAEILRVFGRAWLVGGAVRDAKLGRPVKDLDLAVEGVPDFKERVSRLGRRLGAAAFPLDEERGVYRLSPRPGGPEGGIQLDISPFQGKDLRSDLLRRDFTINAMALPLAPSFRPVPAKKPGLFRLPSPDRTALIDPALGLKDLRSGTVRMVSPSAFSEDPLRLLRAFRFASSLGFGIAPGTMKRIRSEA